MKKMLIFTLFLLVTSCATTKPKVVKTNYCKDDYAAYRKALYICKSHRRHTILNKRYYCAYARRYRQACWWWLR